MRRHSSRIPTTHPWLIVFLVPLLLLMTTAGSAEAAKLMWQAPFEGAFTPDQGFSLSQGAFVPLDQSDVVMQDRFLVALHGAGIQEVTTDFASLTQTPSDLFFATAMIGPGTAYLIKATDGTYTKLCTCGTYTTGTGGAGYYTQYNVTVAQSASPQTAAAPAPAPAPTAAPGTLTVDGSSGKVLLTWPPMDTPLLSMDPDVQSVTTTAWTSPEQQAKTLDPVLWRLFRLRLPTDAYTDPKGALYSKPGAMTNSLLQFYADGTYTWESAADNRHIAGFWTATDGDVVLLDGEGGQDWTISLDHGSGQGDITVYSDHAR